MASAVAYHPGGRNAGLPPGIGRAEEWDSVAATYTTWDEVGQQVTQRPLSPAEVAAFAATTAAALAETNGVTVRGRAQAALVANATFLALSTPTNAQILAQTRTLTKECNALVRLVLSLLTDVTDTA